MRRLKDWYTYNRQGVIYVQFKDKVTGKKLTAKSTRTRDTEEAAQVINMLYYNPESYFNKSQWKLHKDMFTPMIQATVTEAVESAIKSSLSGKVCKWIYIMSADWNPFVK